jgi:hypothetical protein
VANPINKILQQYTHRRLAKSFGIVDKVSKETQEYENQIPLFY